MAILSLKGKTYVDYGNSKILIEVYFFKNLFSLLLYAFIFTAGHHRQFWSQIPPEVLLQFVRLIRVDGR